MYVDFGYTTYTVYGQLEPYSAPIPILHRTQLHSYLEAWQDEPKLHIFVAHTKKSGRNQPSTIPVFEPLFTSDLDQWFPSFDKLENEF